MFRGGLPSRRDSIRRPSSQDDHLNIPCSLNHVHCFPPARSIDLSSMSDWISKIERQHPLGMLANEAGHSRSVPSKPSLATAITVNPAGYLLLRIGMIKLLNDDKDRSNYQVLVKLGDETASSCLRGRSAGLQDYFLL